MRTPFVEDLDEEARSSRYPRTSISRILSAAKEACKHVRYLLNAVAGQHQRHQPQSMPLNRCTDMTILASSSVAELQLAILCASFDILGWWHTCFLATTGPELVVQRVDPTHSGWLCWSWMRYARSPGPCCAILLCTSTTAQRIGSSTIGRTLSRTRSRALASLS
jgi:hypothetical protein